ncbi:MAG TPA: hypothetical protein VIK89_01670 [Cytophagaceae bacterium]
MNKVTFAEICEIIEEEIRNAERVQEECTTLLDEILIFLEQTEEKNNIQFHNWFCGISYHPGLAEFPNKKASNYDCFKSFDCNTEDNAKGIEKLFLAFGMAGKNKVRKAPESAAPMKYVYFFRIH